MNILEHIERESVNIYGQPVYYPAPNGIAYSKDDPEVKRDKHGAYKLAIQHGMQTKMRGYIRNNI